MRTDAGLLIADLRIAMHELDKCQEITRNVGDGVQRSKDVKRMLIEEVEQKIGDVRSQLELAQGRARLMLGHVNSGD